MKTLLLSLTFILTTSVMAQAANLNQKMWVTQYETDTEINGLPVRARLDVAQMDGDTPIVSLERTSNSRSLLPVLPRECRLVLLVSEMPRVQLAFLLQPRSVSVDGQPRFAYVSELGNDQKLHFLLTTEANGTLHANYSQRGENGEISVGEFSLPAVLHAL
jgi:hypothetical protein